MEKQLSDDDPISSGDAMTEWRPEMVRKRWEGLEGRFAGQGVTRLLLRRCRRYISGDILDVGAGMGGPMRLLPRAIGLDLAPRQPRSVGGDMCLMPFKAEAFDTIFSIEVLEHLPGDRLGQGLSEIRRVLRPGGHAILVTPYREPLARRMTVCPHCGTKFHWLGHVHSFDEASLGAAVGEAGLTVVETHVLHLNFKGQHRLLGAFSFLLGPMGLEQPKNMVMVARRPA
jgi:SAM-dependent methyltransferase